MNCYSISFFIPLFLFIIIVIFLFQMAYSTNVSLILYFLFSWKKCRGERHGKFYFKSVGAGFIGESGESVTIFGWWGAKVVSQSWFLLWLWELWDLTFIVLLRIRKSLIFQIMLIQTFGNLNSFHITVTKYVFLSSILCLCLLINPLAIALINRSKPDKVLLDYTETEISTQED